MSREKKITESIKAWHFVNDTLRDGSPIPKDGAKLIHDGPLIICESGYHASLDPFDALQFAPGQTLCYVECGGEIVHQDDKLVCRERTIIRRQGFEPLLWQFAREQALSVIHLWDAPDIVREYLETGNDGLKAAARAAAWAAARAAARAAAWADAWADARAAAWADARQRFNAIVRGEFGLDDPDLLEQNDE